MIDLEIRQYRDSIIAMTNASQIPIEVKRLALLEVYNMVVAESERIIHEEKSKKEKESGNGENKGN